VSTTIRNTARIESGASLRAHPPHARARAVASTIAARETGACDPLGRRAARSRPAMPPLAVVALMAGE
jgi:hypothetical protein